MRASLDEIALQHGTDKASPCHNYTAPYARWLEPIRDQPITLLEIGYGGHEDPDLGGASARMWRDYLPNATIVVIDNEAKNGIPDGVSFRHGSQADPEFIATVAAEFGPFDVIVDDASHVSSLTIASFELLWPHLTPGGLYVVEDSHSSYHDFYYGRDEAHENPDKPTSTGAPTAIQFFKRIADEVNYLSDWSLFPQLYHRGYFVESVEFLFNLVAVRKRTRPDGDGSWASEVLTVYGG